MEDADLSFASLLLALRHSTDELDKSNFMPAVKVLLVHKYWQLSYPMREGAYIQISEDMT